MQQTVHTKYHWHFGSVRDYLFNVDFYLKVFAMTLLCNSILHRVEDLQLKNRLFWWNFLWRYEYPWLKHKLSRRMLNSVLLYSGDFLFRFVIALFYLTDIYLTCSVCNPNERILLPNFNEYLCLNTGYLRTIMTLNAKQNAMKLRSFNNDCLTSGFFGSYSVQQIDRRKRTKTLLRACEVSFHYVRPRVSFWQNHTSIHCLISFY